MRGKPNFDTFMKKYLQEAPKKTKIVYDIGLVESKELWEILCFYRDEVHRGNYSSWFGCTGIDGIYYTYEYIYNYKKSEEVVYKFKSEYNLP
jgi:hypothetical protein